MVTLKMVAERAGVSLCTVSCALAGTGVVKAATRERLVKLAEEMGYQRDASAAVMASRRHRARVRERRLSLGWLQSPHATEKKSRAFAARAGELGYDVEWINLHTFKKPEAAVRTLWHRNVAGLYVSSPGAIPEPRGEWDRFEWGKFAAVKFTRALPHLAFPLIRHSAFDYAARSVREVCAAGYRRVAVLLDASTAPLDDEARLGAVLSYRELRLRKGERLEWRYRTLGEGADGAMDGVTRSWLRTYRPDAIIGFPSYWFYWLKEAGFDVPGEVAFAAVLTGDGDKVVAGCAMRRDAFAEAAADLLHRQIMTGVRGPMEMPPEYVIEPSWVSAASLPVKG